jgi:hypothetical protein
MALSSAPDGDSETTVSLRALRRGGRLIYADLFVASLECCRGHVFGLTYAQLARGEWCRRCFVSVGETRIASYLDRLGVLYHRERTFPAELYHLGPLRLDFYVPSLRLAIEYDGAGHHDRGGRPRARFRDALYRDQLKDAWCRRTHRGLLRIPYWRLDSLESILEQALARARTGERVHVDEAETWRIACLARLDAGHDAGPGPRR